MEKEEFNKLKVQDQVEYINQKLDRKSLTEICKDINISRATIRKRFLKQGYLFDKSNNKYKSSSETNNKAQKENKCENNTKVLEEKIQALESKIEAIENKLNNSSGINVKKFEGKTVSRCYRLYEEVQKDFSKFCKENSNYKVQDILSMALYEYMKSNKK